MSFSSFSSAIYRIFLSSSSPLPSPSLSLLHYPFFLLILPFSPQFSSSRTSFPTYFYFLFSHSSLRSLLLVPPSLLLSISFIFYSSLGSLLLVPPSLFPSISYSPVLLSVLSFLHLFPTFSFFLFSYSWLHFSPSSITFSSPS